MMAKKRQLLAVRAGVNIELPEPDCYSHLVELVQEAAARRIGTRRTRCAAARPEVPDGSVRRSRTSIRPKPSESSAATSIVNWPSKPRVKTITLLKNDGERAPLNPRQNQNIAVIGPNADRRLLGGYSGRPKHSVDGARWHPRATSRGRVEVLYHEGCKITNGGSWQQDEVVPSDPDEDGRTILQAAELAKQADAIVLAIGGNEQTSREAWMGNHLGDRASLDMVGQQNELVDALAATGKPILRGLVQRPAVVNQ